MVLAVQGHMKSMRNNTSRKPDIQTQSKQNELCFLTCVLLSCLSPQFACYFLSKQVIRLICGNNIDRYNAISRKKINPQLRKK